MSEHITIEREYKLKIKIWIKKARYDKLTKEEQQNYKKKVNEYLDRPSLKLMGLFYGIGLFTMHEIEINDE